MRSIRLDYTDRIGYLLFLRIPALLPVDYVEDISIFIIQVSYTLGVRLQTQLVKDFARLLAYQLLQLLIGKDRVSLEIRIL